MPADTRQTYEHPVVVGYYARDRELQEAERVLLDEYLQDGMAVLDLGVGAGRTTPYLAPRAARYVGLDYSGAMVAQCRGRFPRLSFVNADAAALPFRDGSFDLVLFSFNGLGSIPDDESRRRCVMEFRRVLRRGGVFLFSLHNPRFLFTRPVLGRVGALRGAWRIAYAAYQSIQNVPRRLLSGAFWRGAGYLIDPALHGGLRVYVASPREVQAQLSQVRFVVERCLPGPDAHVRSPVVVRWYYYACTARL